MWIKVKIANNEDIIDRVEKKVADVLTSSSEDEEEKDKNFKEAFGKLTASIGGLNADISQLRAIMYRQKVLLYVTIGFLVLLLMVKN